MSATRIGRLTRVPLREVWKHEALDFTQWLALPENLELLGESIEVELAEARTEVGVGAFKVDILAKDTLGDRTVVIENQLEASNHDHLGKIITYAAGHAAEVVVWIVQSARDEHQKAVDWLNENTLPHLSFFLIEAQAWRIGTSEPAPAFEIVTKPNDWARAVKQADSDAALDFDPEIQAFYERVRAHGEANKSAIARWRPASARRWYDISVGSSEAHVALRVTKLQGRVSVELYIDDNKELFDSLYRVRDELEAAIGEHLEWNRLDGKKAARIIATRPGAFNDSAVAEELVAWLVATAEKFASAFGPRL